MTTDADLENNPELKRMAIVEACARHAWEQRQEELQRRGIPDEAALGKHIDSVLDTPATEAFRCQPQPEREQTVGREIYNLPFDDKYQTTIILNANHDASGNLYGGSCWIRETEKSEFQRLERKETRDTGIVPERVIGGRAALLATVERTEDTTQQTRTATQTPRSRASSVDDDITAAKSEAKADREISDARREKMDRAQGKEKTDASRVNTDSKTKTRERDDDSSGGRGRGR